MRIYPPVIRSKVVVAATLFLSFSCALLCMPCYAGQQVPLGKPAIPHAETVSQWLIEQEKLTWDLAIKHEADRYRAFHSPDFFSVGGGGVSDRIHSEDSAMDDHVSFASCQLTAFDVHYTGENAALITYRVNASGLDHGKDFKIDQYVSSLWMKRDGKWINVFYQATPAEDK
jgi:hypothetical protein